MAMWRRSRGLKDPDKIGFAVSEEEWNQAIGDGPFLLDDDRVGYPADLCHPLDTRPLPRQEETLSRRDHTEYLGGWIPLLHDPKGDGL